MIKRFRLDMLRCANRSEHTSFPKNTNKDICETTSRGCASDMSTNIQISGYMGIVNTSEKPFNIHPNDFLFMIYGIKINLII